MLLRIIRSFCAGQKIIMVSSLGYLSSGVLNAYCHG